MAVDSAGNCYVHGTFTRVALFGTNQLTSAGSNDVFVAKYDNTGALLWINQAGGPGNEDDYNPAIAIDSNGNCYIGGGYLLNATFGNETLTNAGDHDIFVAKYDSNGVFRYVQRAGGTNYDYCRGVGVDRNGNCYLTGSFSGTAGFGTLSLTSSGDNDMFLAKLAAFNPGNELNLVPANENGIISLSVFGLTGQSVEIDTTPELSPEINWTTLTNFIMPTSPFVISDGSPINHSNRFYRAELVP
jgi:Beta-propeller repeat